jgi:hypothetical protein
MGTFIFFFCVGDNVYFTTWLVGSDIQKPKYLYCKAYFAYIEKKNKSILKKWK